MNILGFGGPFFLHDPAAAILVDGRVAAAAEEERFTRKKHAVGEPSINSIRFCLEKSGIGPGDIAYAAFPWSFNAYNSKKWAYALKTCMTEPSRAYKTIVKASRKNTETRKMVQNILARSGINIPYNRIRFVEHHMTHAASCYNLSGYKDAAIMTIDGSGEFTSTLFASGEKGKINKIKEIDLPDSIGRFYSTITAYLGFSPNNGEYKVMGMAPYGDPSKVDLSDMIRLDNEGFKINPEMVWPISSRRFRREAMIPKKLVDKFGPPREGDGLTEPYIHIAAAAQKIFEDIIIELMERYLGETLKKTGRLVFAGGCALNVVLNRRILEHPLVNELYVQPASHDAGTSLGAAVFTASGLGETIEPMRDVYLGPSYSNDEIENALKSKGLNYRRSEDVESESAKLLNNGKVIGWFQGSMEYGPRALGNRSILGNPVLHGTSDRINEMIKFREKWRPFCPSILREHIHEIIGRDIDSPFMTFSFKVTEEWKNRIPEVVHVNGTMRPQTVEASTNPRFYKLIKAFRDITGVPVLINTSLNRRGEPMACSPRDAIDIFIGSGLDNLVIGDFIVSKNGDKING